MRIRILSGILPKQNTGINENCHDTNSTTTKKVGKKIVLNKKGVFFHISFHIIVHLGSPYNSTVSVFPEMNTHQKNMDTFLNITSEAKLFLKGIPMFLMF